MEMKEGLKALEQLLDPYDWFYEACIEGNRYVVYVHRMEKEQDTLIPSYMMGHQVLVHFAGSKLIDKNDYVSRPSLQVMHYTSYATSEPSKLNVEALTDELDRLERMCGSNILEQIFFEIHDRMNAITNLSIKFLKVRESLEKLYDKYGFEIIYNELEL